MPAGLAGVKREASHAAQRSWGVRQLRRLVFLGVSALIGLGLCEAFVRWFDPYGVSQFVDMQRYLTELVEELPGDPRLFRHRPNQRLECHGFAIETNSLGLRAPELTKPRPEGGRRLLFLGDSVVLGWGAPEGQTFVRLTEGEIQVVNREARIECINAGHNQFDTVQEAALLDHLLAIEMDPDAVLLVFVDNDIQPTAKVLEAYRAAVLEQQRQPPSFLARAWSWLRANPFRGINCLYIYATQVAGGRDAAPPAAAFTKAETEGLELCKQALLHMQTTCNQRDIPFVVLDHTLDPRLRVLEAFCREQAITWHPFRFTGQELESPIRRSASDPHANELGHALLLGKLRPVLTSLGYLGEKK
jgi:hypothetical protein